jgi:hypothetical protein
METFYPAERAELARFWSGAQHKPRRDGDQRRAENVIHSQHRVGETKRHGGRAVAIFAFQTGERLTPSQDGVLNSRELGLRLVSIRCPHHICPHHICFTKPSINALKGESGNKPNDDGKGHKSPELFNLD